MTSTKNYQFTCVVFGLTSTPFLLNGTIKQHLEKYMLNPNFTEIIKKLIMNLYVDDSANSFDNLQIIIGFYEKSKACLKDANFELQKWATNNCVIQKYIDQNQDPNKELNDSETCVKSLYGTTTSTE